MQKSQTADLLSKLEVGILPKDIFHEIARLVPLAAVEVVPLREKDGDIEILMLKRGVDDVFWPNLWHTPGSIVRAYDKQPDFQDALGRVLDDELQGTLVGAPSYITSLLHESERGKEVAIVHWVEVEGESTIGKFFSAQALPDDRVLSQPFIGGAIADFKKTKGIL